MPTIKMYFAKTAMRISSLLRRGHSEPIAAVIGKCSAAVTPNFREVNIELEKSHYYPG